MNRKHDEELRARLEAALTARETASIDRVLRDAFWRPPSRPALAGCAIVPIARR